MIYIKLIQEHKTEHQEKLLLFLIPETVFLALYKKVNMYWEQIIIQVDCLENKVQDLLKLQII